MEERIFWPELESDEALRKFMEETPSLKSKTMSYDKWWEDSIKEEGEDHPLNDAAFFINRTMDPLAALFEDEPEAAAFREADARLQEAIEKGEGLKEAHRQFRAGIFGMLQHINPLWSVGKDLLAMWNASQKEEPSVYRLGVKDYELFDNLATVDQAPLLRKKGVVAFGSVLPDEETGHDTAASLLIFADKEADDICPVRRAEILWLFTSPQVRMQHAADELMAALYWYCAQNGIFLVRADVPSRGFLPLYFLPYFLKWHIPLSVEEEPEIHTSILELDGKLNFDAMKNRNEVEALDSIPQRQVRAFYKKTGLSEDDADDLDRSMSCGILENGELRLLMPVVKHPSGAFEAGYILPAGKASEAEATALLTHPLDLALEMPPRDNALLIHAGSEKEAAVLDRLFPKHGIPVHYRGFNVLDPEDESADIDMPVYDTLRSFYYLCRAGKLQEIMASMDIPRDTEALNPYAAVLALINENPEIIKS